MNRYGFSATCGDSAANSVERAPCSGVRRYKGARGVASQRAHQGMARQKRGVSTGPGEVEHATMPRGFRRRCSSYVKDTLHSLERPYCRNLAGRSGMGGHNVMADTP